MQPSMEFGIVQKVFGVHTLNPIVCVQCSCSLMPNTVGLRVIFDFFKKKLLFFKLLGHMQLWNPIYTSIPINITI